MLTRRSFLNVLAAGAAGTLGLLAEIGYKEVELFGPYPFSVPQAHERWSMVSQAPGFRQSGYFGRTVCGDRSGEVPLR